MPLSARTCGRPAGEHRPRPSPRAAPAGQRRSPSVRGPSTRTSAPTTRSAAVSWPLCTVTAVVPQNTTRATAMVSVSRGTRVPAVRLARAVATIGTRPRRRDARRDSARSRGGRMRATTMVAAAASSTGVAASSRSTPPVAVCSSPRPRTETRAATAIATSEQLGGEPAHAPTAEDALPVCPVGRQASTRPRAGDHDRRRDRGCDDGDRHDHRRDGPGAADLGLHEPRADRSDHGGRGDQRHRSRRASAGPPRRSRHHARAPRRGTSAGARRAAARRARG